MEIDNLQVGQLYTTQYMIGASCIEFNGDYSHHAVYNIYPGDIFMLTYFCEVKENSTLDIEILFSNKKMFFTFSKNSYNIDDVRRAESYDIPFVTLKEAEPGSNSSSLVEYITPHTK